MTFKTAGHGDGKAWVTVTHSLVYNYGLRGVYRWKGGLPHAS